MFHPQKIPLHQLEEEMYRKRDLSKKKKKRKQVCNNLLTISYLLLLRDLFVFFKINWIMCPAGQSTPLPSSCQNPDVPTREMSGSGTLQDPRHLYSIGIRSTVSRRGTLQNPAHCEEFGVELGPAERLSFCWKVSLQSHN
jgi:hypothetical protein